MAKDNKTLHVILGLLAHEDLTGYGIKKRIDSSLAFFWDAGFGQIYPSLGVLEREGLVSKRTEAYERQPKRIIYSITEAGRSELKKWLATPVEKEPVRYEILLRLFFGSQLPVGDSIKRIEEFGSRHRAHYETMLQYKKELEDLLPQGGDHFFIYLTVLFGEKVYRAYLDWVEEAKGMLEDVSKRSHLL